MSDEFVPSEPDLWCRGCRRTGTRPLAHVERTWIECVRAAHRVRAFAGLVIVPLAFVSGVAVAAVHPSPAGDLWGLAIATWVFVTLLLGVPVTILLLRDNFAAAADLGRDLAGGSAWLFEPPQDAPPTHDAAGAEIRTPNAAAFAMLPRSRRIVDPDDLTPRVRREDVIEVEPHAGSGLYAPLSLEVERALPGLRFHQRPLSEPERDELEQIRHRLTAPRVSTALALAALVVLLGLVIPARPWASAGSRDHVGDFFGLGLAIFLAVRMLVRDARSVLLAVRIRKDLHVGLIVRVDGDSGSGSEFLPISRLLWRLGGAPAAWRDRGRAADRLLRSL